MSTLDDLHLTKDTPCGCSMMLTCRSCGGIVDPAPVDTLAPEAALWSGRRKVDPDLSVGALIIAAYHHLHDCDGATT